MRTAWKGMLAAAMCVLPMAGGAQEPGDDKGFFSPPRAVGVSLDVSVALGAGLSVGVPISDRFNLRAVYHGFSYDADFEDATTEYEADLRLRTLGLKGDWHPFEGVFRVTAGLMSNGNQMSLTARDNGTSQYVVGECTFTSDPADPLTITGLLDFRKTAPYLGLGWGGNMNGGKGFYGTLDMGVMFSGAPRVGLTGRGSVTAASGPGDCSLVAGDVSDDPAFQEAIAEAERQAEAEGSDFKLWPNVAFGIGWRF